jgi:hypothetical protein
MLNVSLSYCIQWAYSVKFYQVEGPDWVKQQRYEIVAKTEQPVSTADLRIMLQALLTDRFKLKLRRESKSKPIYAVVAGSTHEWNRDVCRRGWQLCIRPYDDGGVAERLSDLGDRSACDRQDQARRLLRHHVEIRRPRDAG